MLAKLQKGFSLIEVAIIISVVGIVIAIILPRGGPINKSNEGYSQPVQHKECKS